MKNTGQSGGVAGADIKATAAWELVREAPNVIVAVLDTGVNLTHQDIAPNLWRNPSPTFGDVNGARFLNGQQSGNPTDDNGHGTHVAGTIGAVGDNNIAAYRFATERINKAGGVLGRQMEIVVADSELKPDVATRRANDLVLGDKVDVLVVNTGSNIAKAVSQVASQAKKVFFSTGTEASELTGEEFFDTTFRCCLNTDMHSAELAIYFAKLAPQKYTKFYLLNQDYNFGRAAADGFKKKFNKIKAANQGPLKGEHVAAIWREIMSACLALESPQRVAVLGPFGTFCEQAAIEYFGGAADLIYCNSFDEVFHATASGSAQYGVVGVENMTEGVVTRSLDLFLHTPTHVVGEVSLLIFAAVISNCGGDDGLGLLCLGHDGLGGLCRERGAAGALVGCTAGTMVPQRPYRAASLSAFIQWLHIEEQTAPGQRPSGTRRAGRRPGL